MGSPAEGQDGAKGAEWLRVPCTPFPQALEVWPGLWQTCPVKRELAEPRSCRGRPWRPRQGLDGSGGDAARPRSPGACPPCVQGTVGHLRGSQEELRSSRRAWGQASCLASLPSDLSISTTLKRNEMAFCYVHCSAVPFVLTDLQKNHLIYLFLKITHGIEMLLESDETNF